MSNSYGIDMGTNNLKIYSSNNSEIINVKNTIAIVDKDQMYAYGDDAYSMYEKAPETISVSFPIVSGVIADFDNMQKRKQRQELKVQILWLRYLLILQKWKRRHSMICLHVLRQSHIACYYVKNH